jgi:hypothetical protein
MRFARTRGCSPCRGPGERPPPKGRKHAGQAHSELAEDGEAREGVVVQGCDRRLKDATTASKA